MPDFVFRPPPPGAVAVIHTHPIIPTERIKVPSCVNPTLERLNITDPDEQAEVYESGVTYYSKPSIQDNKYAENYSITSYYMDGTTIEKYYDGTDEKEVSEMESRCGY